MIHVWVSQQFPVKRRRGDRAGFAFVAADLRAAKKELGQWRATDIALDGAPSFVAAEFYDREAWLEAVRAGRTIAPFLVIKR